jgi:hypothetical protein
MARILLDAKHPWGQIFTPMVDIDPELLEETMIQYKECIVKVYVQCLGRFHGMSLNSQIRLVEHCYEEENLSPAEKRLLTLYSQSREVTGGFSKVSFDVVLVLGDNLFSQGKYAEAESKAVELLNLAREIWHNDFQVYGRENVANAQCKVNRCRRGESTRGC